MLFYIRSNISAVKAIKQKYKTVFSWVHGVLACVIVEWRPISWTEQTDSSSLEIRVSYLIDSIYRFKTRLCSHNF